MILVASDANNLLATFDGDSGKAIIAAYPGRKVYSFSGTITLPTPVPGTVVGPVPIPAGAVLLNPPLDLYDYAASQKNARIDTGSVSVGGFSVPTDAKTRNFLAGAAVKIARDPTYGIDDWKIANGNYVALDAFSLLAMGDAVEAFVQAMFTRNKLADAAIAAGTATTTAQVDTILSGG